MTYSGPATYLFYDLETTGLNPAFDQILQFAALRTDETLTEMESHNIRIRLRPDVVPSPDAILTHGIGVRQALEDDPCEFEALGRIHKLLNTPGSISLGYNSLGFDDDFLRFGFYRNLLPAYTHQYARGCRRMDLLPITVLFWLYGPEVIRWPLADGKPTLRLEQISRINQLAAGPAHDALVDVNATAALARRFQQARPMWDYILGYFDKAEDARRCGRLPPAIQGSGGNHRLGIAVDSQLGFKRMFQAPVLALGNSIPYANQTLWLRLDTDTLKDTAADTMDETTWVVRKKYGEPVILLPPLERYWQKLPEPVRDQAKANLELLAGRPDLLEAIGDYHRSFRYPQVPDLDVDAALYELGFLESHEEALCREFRRAAPGDRGGLVHRFERRELRQLAGRIFGRNYPQLLPKELAEDYRAYLRRTAATTEDQIPRDYRGHLRVTPAAALERIAEIRSGGAGDPAGLRLLDDLERHIRCMAGQAAEGRW